MTASGKPATQGSAPVRLDGLDALRGIAALLVAVMHIQHISGGGDLFARAYLAVDVFFVLSGYVMARTYEPKFACGMRLRDFSAVRLKRLWPTMCIGALLGMAACWSDMAPLGSLMAFVMAALFIPFFNDRLPQFPTNPPAWSVVLELLANAVHILGLRYLGVRGLVGLAAICAAILMASTATMNVGDVGGLGLARVLFSYCAGIVIWRTCGERALLPGWLGLIALPLAILLIARFPGGTAWADFAFVFLLCPAIVVSGLAPLRFGRRVLTFLGAISFPLYAIHFPLALLLGRAGLGSLATLVLVIAGAWLVSLATNRRWFPRTLRHPLPA